jgi:hypothetical protein
MNFEYDENDCTWYADYKTFKTHKDLELNPRITYGDEKGEPSIE